MSSKKCLMKYKCAFMTGNNSKLFALILFNCDSLLYSVVAPKEAKEKTPSTQNKSFQNKSQPSKTAPDSDLDR